MENKNKFLKIGERVSFKPVTEGLDYGLEPNKVYTVTVDRYTDELYMNIAPDFVLPEKIYTTASDDKFMSRVLNHYTNAGNGMTGVMLSGLKGSGKTVMAKQIALKSNLPIILIDNTTHPSSVNKLFKLLTSIEACIVFDEFDKVGERYDTNQLLKVFDGINTSGKKLVLFTCNDENEINKFMLDRCSRIRYWRKFSEINPAMIMSILQDKLVDKNEAKSLIDFICENFGCISFDNICSFITEVNENPKDAFEELFADMNLSKK